MPPVGSALSDEQIAAVLTYIRREWGQAGAPVTAAMVAETRALTRGRLRPWTNDELLAIGGGVAPVTCGNAARRAIRNAILEPSAVHVYRDAPSNLNSPNLADAAGGPSTSSATRTLRSHGGR